MVTPKRLSWKEKGYAALITASMFAAPAYGITAFALYEAKGIHYADRDELLEESLFESDPASLSGYILSFNIVGDGTPKERIGKHLIIRVSPIGSEVYFAGSDAFRESVQTARELDEYARISFLDEVLGRAPEMSVCGSAVPSNTSVCDEKRDEYQALMERFIPHIERITGKTLDNQLFFTSQPAVPAIRSLHH